MKIKVSDYVVKCLEKTGSEYMFMLPGGGAMHLNDSLGKSKVIKYVCTQNEQGAAIAAEGYARVSGTPGLLMVTTGPGGTNALTGVAGAYIESTPMIVISGQVKRLDMIRGQGLRQQGMQELDIVASVRPMTKYATLVDDPRLIRYHMKRLTAVRVRYGLTFLLMFRQAWLRRMSCWDMTPLIRPFRRWNG